MNAGVRRTDRLRVRHVVYVALLLSAVIGPIHRAFATEVMRMLIPD
jgi:hypothetical protein